MALPSSPFFDMLTEVEIKKYISLVVKAKLPDWKRNYFERIATNLQVHTKGLLFDKVDLLFPNEHPDSKNHCVSTYEPITKGSVWKAINDVIRIFSNSSFSFTASDNTVEYCNGSNFGGKNLFNFFLEKWVENSIAADPNGLIAIYPEAYTEDRKFDDKIAFIPYSNIRIFTDDIIAFVSDIDSIKEFSVNDSVSSEQTFYDAEINSLNSRTAVVKTYNSKVVCKYTKEVIHLFIRGAFLVLTKEEGEKWNYELFETPEDHPLPAFNVGGVKLHNEIFESFISPFVPFGNLALLQHRNHRAVDLMFSYPRMSELEFPCDAQGCQYDNTTKHFLSGGAVCTRCKGSGTISVQSPYKIYKKKISTGLSTDSDELQKAIMQTPPVEFMTPDPGILDYSKNSWKDYLRMAEEAVFITISKNSADAESADAKRLDREDKYAWLMNIAKVYFERLRMTIQAIENYLNPTPVDCSVEVPVSFAIFSEGEAFEALNIILNSNAPIMIKAQQVENFMHKFVSKTSPVIKAMRILKKVDPLLYYGNAEVQIFKSNNVVKPETWTTHIYAYPVLMQLYEEDKQIFDKPETAIIELVNEELKKLIPTVGGDLKTSIVKTI